MPRCPERREISLYASRPLRRSEAGRKSRLAPFEMTVGGVGDMRRSARSVRNDGWGLAWSRKLALRDPLHGEFLALLGAGKKDAGLPDTHRRAPPQFGGKAQRYDDSREDKDRASSGEEGLSGHGARREERILTSAGRPHRRSESERKSLPAPVEMTAERQGQHHEVGLLRSE